MLGETSYPMVWLWFIGACVLGVALVYGVMRAGRLRRHEKARLEQDTVQAQQRNTPTNVHFRI